MFLLLLQVKVSEIPSLHSNQEETDTRIVLYLHHTQTSGFKSAVIHTPDTNIFFILLHHAHALTITLYIDIGTGKHRQLINVSEMAHELGREWCSTLLGFYVFSGEDCTSAFKGKGKVTPLKKLQKNPKFHGAFRLVNHMISFLKNTYAFTILILYQYICNLFYLILQAAWYILEC